MSAAPSNHSDDAPACDERFDEDFDFDEKDCPFSEKDAFKSAGGVTTKTDQGGWRKWAPAGSRKADFQRWTRARIYLKNDFKDNTKVRQAGGEFDWSRKEWFVPSYVQVDGNLGKFARWR